MLPAHRYDFPFLMNRQIRHNFENNPASGLLFAVMNATLATKLVLIADDYEEVAEMLAEIVRGSTPHDVVAVLGGQQALEAAGVRRPDAVILDIDMPGVDGITAARGLRAMFRQKPPLLIACSGRHSSLAEQSGQFDHVSEKPVDFDQLLGWLTPAL